MFKLTLFCLVIAVSCSLRNLQLNQTEAQANNLIEQMEAIFLANEGEKVVRNFDLFKTSSARNIKIQLLDVYKEAGIYIKNTGSNHFGYFTGVGEGSSPRLDITDYLTEGTNDQIKITNRVAKPHFFARYQRSVTLMIWVDDQQVYHQTISCKGCHSADPFQCSINKMSGAVLCKRND